MQGVLPVFLPYAHKAAFEPTNHQVREKEAVVDNKQALHKTPSRSRTSVASAIVGRASRRRA